MFERAMGGLQLPNVQDQPRPRPPPLLHASIDQSVVSFDSTYVSRRRDGRGRWLWRLVGRTQRRSDLRDESACLFLAVEAISVLLRGSSPRPSQSCEGTEPRERRGSIDLHPALSIPLP